MNGQSADSKKKKQEDEWLWKKKKITKKNEPLVHKIETERKRVAHEGFNLMPGANRARGLRDDCQEIPTIPTSSTLDFYLHDRWYFSFLSSKGLAVVKRFLLVFFPSGRR